MAVMYSFCLYFSVRLGAVLVAVSSMIQSLIVGGVFNYWLINIDQSRESLQHWITSNQLIYMINLFQSFHQNTELYLESALIFIMLHICTCALLIYGALKCYVPFMWPYLFVELLRLIILIFVQAIAMILTKENVLDLGVLIVLSISGGFFLLGLYYCWFCVISLWQCIQELDKSPLSANQLTNANANFLPMDMKHLTSVTTNFPPQNNHQAISSLGSSPYQYSNLTMPTY